MICIKWTWNEILITFKLSCISCKNKGGRACAHKTHIHTHTHVVQWRTQTLLQNTKDLNIQYMQSKFKHTHTRPDQTVFEKSVRKGQTLFYPMVRFHCISKCEPGWVKFLVSTTYTEAYSTQSTTYQGSKAREHADWPHNRAMTAIW